MKSIIIFVDTGTSTRNTKESIEDIGMNMNSAYETVMIPLSTAAPPVPPVTAERLMIVPDTQMGTNVYESVIVPP